MRIALARCAPGDWDRAVAIASEVLDDDLGPDVVRMVAQEELGLIAALRGDRRRARGPLRRAAVFGRNHGVFGIEVGAMSGLAVVADLDGDDAEARATVSGIVERCLTKELSHFALPALRWAATFSAVRDEREALARCHRLLATAATQNSSAKVLSALAHAGARRLCPRVTGRRLRPSSTGPSTCSRGSPRRSSRR